MAELDPLGPIMDVLFAGESSDYVLQVLGLSGILTRFELSTQDLYSHDTWQRAYRARLTKVLVELSETQCIQVAENIAREIGRNEVTRSRLEDVLRSVGWTLAQGSLIPVARTHTSMTVVASPDNNSPNPVESRPI